VGYGRISLRGYSYSVSNELVSHMDWSDAAFRPKISELCNIIERFIAIARRVLTIYPAPSEIASVPILL
jgi:hypothetical protein